MELENIVKPLLKWYQSVKRNLPWRDKGNVYYTWISEIMLQQTRVEAVKEYYLRFIKKIPDVFSLSQIDEDELLKLWEGLGYYSRARNLQKAAKIIVQNYNGIIPNSYEKIIALPGIGSYTAGAILSIGYQLPYPAVDGNVMRILARLLEANLDIKESSTKKKFEQLLIPIMPKKAGDFNQAFMDLGAGICLPKEPKCPLCPLKKYCQSYIHETTHLYPVKNKKTNRKIENHFVLLFCYQDSVLIHKRPSTGLLANLYEFYQEIGTISLDKLKEALQEKNISYQEIYSIGSTKHIFSHIEWNMEGFFIELNEKIELSDYFWCPISQLMTKYSIPSAFQYFKKYLLFEKENKLF